MPDLPKSFIPDTANDTSIPPSFVPEPDKVVEAGKGAEFDSNEISRLSEGVRQNKFAGFFKGVAKGAGETLQSFGQGLLSAPALLPGGKTFTERKEEIEETTGIDKKKFEAETGAERAGKFVEGVAEFALPLSKVTKLTKGANFLIRMGSRIATAAGVGTAQEGEFGREAKLAGGIEGVLGVGGAVARPIFSIVKRLFKGLGSGLSGVPTDAIDTIVQNPQKALEVSKQLEKSGNFAVLEQNARTIVNGVSKIRQNAREAFGKGLKTLREADITPKEFRASTQKFLDSVGSTVKGKFRELTNVEFTTPRLIQKASNLIEQLNTTKLDGLSLRKLLNRIENAKFKTTGTDVERLSFNAFLKDFDKAIRGAIDDSTDKLKDLNKEFSTDMQLTEGIERIFGKIKFKSLKEIDAVAQKLEQLFSQKGLNPRDIDRFLQKLGISPQEFRTSEAVRQITGKVSGANTRGLTFAEIAQQITSSVLTPTAIKNVSIFTGLTAPATRALLESVAPSARAGLIEFIVNNQE